MVIPIVIGVLDKENGGLGNKRTSEDYRIWPKY